MRQQFRRGGELLAAAITFLMLASAAGPAAYSQVPGRDAASDGTGTPAVVVQRNGSAPSVRGPEASFTGSVRIDMPFRATSPARVSGGTITFEPGARTAWHTHPLGQTLVVMAGIGWVQQWGSRAQEIRPGDVVWVPPGVKHWHGATATSGMTHLGISEQLDGKSVDWMEHVSDAQYRQDRQDRDSFLSPPGPRQ